MTAPAPETSVTLEQLEAASTQEATKPVNLAEVKLEGDDIPEHLRGKTASDAIAQVVAMQKALLISEDARKQAQTNAELAMRQPQVQAPAPPAAPPELTPDELNELYEKEPIKAIAYMQQQGLRQAERNLESRLGPLFQGTAVSIEQQAREKYKEEFELFGDQITQIASQLPGGRSALANPQAWDDLVSLVRGRTGNMEKIFERKTAKAAGAQQQQAQQTQAQDAGIVMNSTTRAPVAPSGAFIDPTEREIMRELGIQTDAEWLKWRNMG